MSHTWITRFAVGLIGLSLMVAPPALAASTLGGDPDATVKAEVNDDLFTAGQSVSITAPIRGELFAAGQTVTITNRPDRSLFAAGESVSVPNGAGYNAFVGGQTVILAGEYGHDVYVAGNSVVLEPGTLIRGSLFAAGSAITLHGTVDGRVRISAESVSSDAVIGNDAKIDTSTLSFSGGSIGGNLRFNNSATTKGLDTVAVAGATIRADESVSADTDRRQGGALPVIFKALMAFVTMVVIGGVFLVLTRERVASINGAVKSAWAVNALTGIVALIVIPLVVLLAFMTVLGWPIALIMMLLYAATLTASTFVSPIVLGALIVKTDKATLPWQALVLGTLIVAVTTSLPVIGWLPALAVWIGLTLPIFGASLRWIWQSLRS